MTLAVRYLSARTLDTAPAPSAPPGPGEVELAPAYVGICGTDLHIFHGDMDARVAAPAVLGHEMSGRVVRVGPDRERQMVERPRLRELRRVRQKLNEHDQGGKVSRRRTVAPQQ